MTEKLDNFLNNNAPLKAIVFDYYLNFIPFYMNMFSPLFVFIAVIFFTSKMASNTEIVAILASGVSFRRMMVPYFISATIICVISFVLGGYIIPRSNEKKLDFEDTYVKPIKKSNVRNVQMEVEKGVVMYIERYDVATNVGYRFSLDNFDDKTLVSRLIAERITWNSDFMWTVNDYQLREFDGMHESVKGGVSMDTIIAVQPFEFFITSQESGNMNINELGDYLKRQKNRGVGNIQAFLDEYYKRFSTPLAAYIMTLIGVTLSSRKVRGGIGLHLGIGVALSALYILFSTFSTTFSVSGMMSPFVAVWLPNFIFLAIGIYLYRLTPK